MILLPQRAHTASSSEGYRQLFVPLTRDRRRRNENGRQVVEVFRPATVNDAAQEFTSVNHGEYSQAIRVESSTRSASLS